MTELPIETQKRKVLSLKKEGYDVLPVDAPRYLQEDLSVYMVWCPDGEMPKRVYKSNEKNRAVAHAMKLAAKTGRKFYVMRSWRGFEPE